MTGLSASGDTLGFASAILLLLGGAFAWWLDATTLQSVGALAPGVVLLYAAAAVRRREQAGWEVEAGRFVVVVLLATGLALGFDVAASPERPASFAFVAAIFLAIAGTSDRFYMRPPRAGVRDDRSDGR